MAKKSQTRGKRTERQVNRIDVLPDDVLLEIFDFYVDLSQRYAGRRGTEAWQSLVHVCRRWRSLVLGSPRRLDLQLLCTPETPIRDKLDVWPALPLIVRDVYCDNMALSHTDNVIAALEQSNRVGQVNLYPAPARRGSSSVEKVLATMQVPFPELTSLQLTALISDDEMVIPDSFLGGSAPRLRVFILSGIPFPGLPNLLLSATHLDTLQLCNIPYSGYISPEAIVALLSVLSSLRTLWLEFQSRQSRPDGGSRSLPSPKRSILPALDSFYFKGVTEYLEELVTRIDAPQLDEVYIIFFDQIDLGCPRLAQFIDRTPTLRARDNAHVQFGKSCGVALLARSRTLEIVISCSERYQQLSSAVQVCISSLPRPQVSTVEDLYIERRLDWSERVWDNYGIENSLWLELLLPFTTVKSLYISEEFALSIAAALQELDGARITEVLPKLQNILVEGFEPSGLFHGTIGHFVAERQLSGQPIAISAYHRFGCEDSDTE